MSRHLHIISFDIPYPADYGGVIDVFYKLKAFHKAGVNVHLHCFEYGREHSDELNKYCSEVHYYKRNTGIKANISSVPYIIKSRISKELEHHLMNDNYPILCEGMHTCGIINNNGIRKNHKLIYRAANIEHDYYRALHKSENNSLKKAYYLAESIKLKKWEPKLKNVDLILTISANDKGYYQALYPNIKTINTFPFFNNSNALQPNFDSKDNYVLFHAKLSVRENIDAALRIIKDIAPNIDSEFKIAGMNPDSSLYEASKDVNNVDIVDSPSDKKMQDLLNNAKVNILITEQATGLKLKLINSLYQSKYIIANNAMLSGSGLNDCVEIANSSNEIISKTKYLLKKDFSENDFIERLTKIPMEYNNENQIETILKYIY
ncbi:MAG: glycosyltransferase [Bacteroidales bacterium]|nr:glycosyltransferase [Bacteroidales bacterium]